MPKSYGQKLKLLYLKDFLTEQSDEQHPLSTNRLMELLAEKGVKVERKTIYDDISHLQEYGMDIRLDRGKNGGYYLVDREFSLPELKLLVDAVQSSKFLTEKKSLELIRKLSRLGGRYASQLLHRAVIVSGRAKSMNETIYYTADAIHDAMLQNSQIRFSYFDWDLPHVRKFRDRTYEASPYALLWDNENYYLIAHSERHGITHFRVDKMANVSLTGTPRVRSAETDAIQPGMYAKKVFGMFSGSETQVTMRFARSLAGVVYDRFGHDSMLIPDGADAFTFTTTVAVSDLFFSWLTEFGDRVQLVYPQSVIDQYTAHLRKILKQYT